MEIFRTVLFADVVFAVDDDAFDLRVEVSRSGRTPDRNRTRIWGLEAFRLQSTFLRRTVNPVTNHRIHEAYVVADAIQSAEFVTPPSRSADRWLHFASARAVPFAGVRWSRNCARRPRSISVFGGDQELYRYLWPEELKHTPMEDRPRESKDARAAQRSDGGINRMSRCKGQTLMRSPCSVRARYSPATSITMVVAMATISKSRANRVLLKSRR